MAMMMTTAAAAASSSSVPVIIHQLHHDRRCLSSSPSSCEPPSPTIISMRSSARLPLLGSNAAAAPSSLFLNPSPRYSRRRPVYSSSSFRCFSALSPQLKSTIDKVVTSHKVILFMKGNKDFPQCGFSNTVVQILKSLNVPFETLDILENELLRQGLKEYSNWPTFPQLYVDGEFFGGCDITLEAYKSGELQEVLERTMCS